MLDMNENTSLMGTVFKMKAAIVLVPISVLGGWRVFLCNHSPPHRHSHAVVYTAELWERDVLDRPQGPASTVPVTPRAGPRGHGRLRSATCSRQTTADTAGMSTGSAVQKHNNRRFSVTVSPVCVAPLSYFNT